MANTTWSTTDKVGCTLSNGNLTVTSTSLGTGIRSVDRLLTGKYYFEITITTLGASSYIGVGPITFPVGTSQITNCLLVDNTGVIRVMGTASGSSLGARANGDTIGFALNLDARMAWLRVAPSGNWNGSATADPATGVGGINLLPVATSAFPLYAITYFNAVSQVVTLNSGDTAFNSAVPAGFTSGFTAGVTPPLYEIVTQAAVEHYSSFTPAMWVTQIAVEQWAEVNTTNPYVLLTQTFIDQWASVATIPNVAADTRAMVLA